MKDFYYILGTDSNCTTAEIKDAYRKLSKKFHPDLNQGDKYFESRFKEINEAYETLRDPDKRFRYNDNLKKSKLKDRVHQNRGRYRPGPISTPVKPGSKRSGTFFNVTLAIIGTIFSIYLIQSFSNSKKVELTKDAVIVAPVIKIHKHHKTKHSLKSKIDADSSKPHLNNPPIKPVKPIPAFNKTTKDTSSNYLYATYVKANPTHIINMRRSGNFNSDVIEKIPDNSKVYVLEKGDIYYRVAYNKYTGYIPRWSLQLK